MNMKQTGQTQPAQRRTGPSARISSQRDQPAPDACKGERGVGEFDEFLILDVGDGVAVGEEEGAAEGGEQGEDEGELGADGIGRCGRPTRRGRR